MSRVRVSGMSAVRCVARVTGVSVSGVPCVSRITRVATISGVPQMCQAANCHRRQPSTAEREAETIKVHTKYYASDRRMVTT
jgi:hypothetical protein